MAIVKISDLPLVDSPVEGTDLFVVVQDNVTKKAYASDIQTYVGFEEVQTATAGQTVFNLTTMTYAAGANNLMVFVDGVNQYEGSSYTETDNNTVTFSQGLHEGALVKFSTVQTQTSSVANAGAVTFLQAGTGAVPTNVQARLRQTVSITDFGGAPGDQDNTAAMNAAAAYLNGIGGGVIQIPTAGEWRMNWVCLYNNIIVQGVGGAAEFNVNCVRPFNISSAAITFGDGNTVVRYCGLENLHISGIPVAGNAAAGISDVAYNADWALRLRGGTVNFTANEVVLYNGRRSLSFEPSATLPVTGCRFNNCTIRNDINNSSAARGIFMQFVSVTAFATDNKFYALKLNGPAQGYAAEAVDCLFEITDSYWDIYPERGLLLAGSSGLVCHNLQLDPGTSPAVIIGWQDATTNPARYIRGILRHGGQLWRNSTGTGALPNESDSFAYRPLYQNTFLSGATYFTEDNDTYNTDYVMAKSASFGSVYLGGAHFIPQNNDEKDLGRSNRRWLNGYINALRPGAGTVTWTSGAGSPEGALTAAVGSLYTDTSGGAGTTLYVKESGAGNTGWVAK